MQCLTYLGKIPQSRNPTITLKHEPQKDTCFYTTNSGKLMLRENMMVIQERIDKDSLFVLVLW
jgi:hypothetical protein